MWVTGSKKGETEKSYQRDGDFNAKSVQESSRFDHCDESHNESVPLYIKHCIKISLVSHLNFLISRLELIMQFSLKDLKFLLLNFIFWH